MLVLLEQGVVPGKKVAIIQSSYIPWVGYFGIIAACDTFIFLDNVQYTRQDWRNRNRIKTPKGEQWLTIPVANDGNFAERRISDTRIAKNSWARNHLNLIRINYNDAPYYKEIMPWLDQLYRNAETMLFLSEVNQFLVKEIADYLEIETRLKPSTAIMSPEDMDACSPNDRLVQLLTKENAGTYLSGPAAKAYMELPLFEKAGIAVKWVDYSHYKPYPQLHGNFAQGVSVIDTLMMLGKDAGSYIRKPLDE